MDNLVQQLGKLVKVRYVEDITGASRVERELVLIKLRAPPGPARTEVLQLTDIFRSSVVDASDRCLTLACTGDSGKIAAFQRALAKFGVVELARTGKIALKRGADLLQMGGWGDGTERTPSRTGARRPDIPSEEHIDVFGNGSGDAEGVWEVENILDAAYNMPAEMESAYSAHTLSILLADEPGILNRVTSVMSRRGYNVQSLAVGHAETPGMSRITVVVPASAGAIDKLIKQIEKVRARGHGRCSVTDAVGGGCERVVRWVGCCARRSSAWRGSRT